MLPNTPPTTESDEPVLLSPVESYFWRFETDLAGAFRVLVLVRLDGCVEAGFLKDALEQLQHRHPKLRARIVEGADGRLRYRFDGALSPIPFEITDWEGEESPWRDEARRLLEIDLTSAASLAAVSVLRLRSRSRSELLFLVSHAIADGLSAITLVDDLLTEYERAEACLEGPRGPALPVVTARRAQPSSCWRGRFRLLRRFIRLKRAESRSPVTALPGAPDIPPQSQWVHWVFSREETVALVRSCRKEKTSLSGVLLAAVCVGLTECLSGQDVVFKWQLPFDLRETLQADTGPVTANDLGCFVSNMNGLVTYTERAALWDLARRIHEEIQTFIELGGPSFGYNMASMSYRTWAAMSRMFPRLFLKLTPSAQQRETLLVSNYGVVSIREAYGSLRPRECTLTFKNQITGPSLVVEALVIGQRLNIGFDADDLEPAFWEQLQRAVARYLRTAIGRGRSAATQDHG